MDQKIGPQESNRELDGSNINHVESDIDGSTDNIYLNRTGKKPVLKVCDFNSSMKN
jgi:hypothetical protein